MKAILLGICCGLLVFSQLYVKAQSKQEIKQAKLLFEGYWSSPKEKRFLSINIERDGRVLINDWTGTFKKKVNIDAYYAHIRGTKLLMPGAEDDHRAPDCEILIQGRRLLFQCKGLLTDTNRFVDKTYFVKM